MPTPRKAARYPAEYSELFRNARKEPMTITLVSNERAVKFRDRLYAFRTAVLAECSTENPAKDLIDLSKFINRAMIEVKGKRLTLSYPKEAV